MNVSPEDVLTAPLRRRKPTTYFVNSMSDLFHVDVPDEVIDRVFAVMALTRQHTYQVLTKRSDRMREYFSAPILRQQMRGDFVREICRSDLSPSNACVADAMLAPYPLPNVWLGVSVEDQKRTDERVPDLLATPAAIRWLSCEPLLGPVDLLSIPAHGWYAPGTGEEWGGRASALRLDGRGLDWIVVGGESGKGARPMHPAWARSLRDQCAAAGVPMFFKQFGDWMPSELCKLDCSARDILIYDETGKVWREAQDDGGWVGDQAMCRVGKKRAGRLLDGVEHNGMPEVSHA